MKRTIARILPARVKDLLRPWYRAIRRNAMDRPSRIAIDSFGGFEVAYREHTADEIVIRQGFNNDIYLPAVPEYQPQEGDVVIDIGAHIGTFALLLAPKIGRGKIHAIEASRDSFNLLRINVALNHCANIAVHHMAVSDKDGQCTLYHDTGNWGHSTVKKLSMSSETVESCTLSQFFDTNKISECQLMRLNCEGAEFPIILRTPSHVLRRVGAILIMYHCDLWGDDTEDKLITHLESSGFKCAIRNREEKRGWIIATK